MEIGEESKLQRLRLRVVGETCARGGSCWGWGWCRAGGAWCLFCRICGERHVRASEERWEGGGGGRQRRRAAWAGARGARAVSAERTYDWAGRGGAREYETETGRSLWRTTAPRLMATVFFFLGWFRVVGNWQARRDGAGHASPRLASPCLAGFSREPDALITHMPPLAAAAGAATGNETGTGL